MKQQTPISPVAVSGQIIGELINLSGRQRMLSQRIVLHALLAARGDSAALTVLRECLASFERAHADLVGGNGHLPGVFSAALREVYFGNRRADERIQQFIALAGHTMASIEAGRDDPPSQLEALVAQATPLLELLQEITLAYQHEMRGIEAAGMKRQIEIAEQLGSISMQANIVALNARISAARAGHHGREFAVITTVLADIIKEMDALIHRVVDPGSAGGTAPRSGAVGQDRQSPAGRALQSSLQ
ncbi:MAG: type IV pili methyl-accepting chemotaxis transducer N-terminal domain-containing protein [Pseudomonadota bacterium]|jgi:hypothetical protein|uniref:type IV pili methyl-accepting chemotaxis transducer N-terminal domain-containing protein n=1 Tax=Burkholderiaceae TaxID=119060 RepID=UPI0010F716A8|nr:type IV pili methyl-accepting chemotaxis transducer N-terminal domain-containing protein [Burkholderia sp. 4M9327F10]